MYALTGLRSIRLPIVDTPANFRWIAGHHRKSRDILRLLAKRDQATEYR